VTALLDFGEPQPTFLGIAILFDDSERMSSLPSREVCSHASVLRTDWVDRPIRRIAFQGTVELGFAMVILWPSKGRVLTIIENAALAAVTTRMLLLPYGHAKPA
jgi:hypothetical protein